MAPVLDVDIAHELDIVGSERVPVPGQLPAYPFGEPGVRNVSVHPFEDPYPSRARSDGRCQSYPAAVEMAIHPDGNTDGLPYSSGNHTKRRGSFRTDLFSLQIRKVPYVFNLHSVNAVVLEYPSLLQGDSDYLLHAHDRPIVAGRTWQRSEMDHPDNWFIYFEDFGQYSLPVAHTLPPPG